MRYHHKILALFLRENDLRLRLKYFCDYVLDVLIETKGLVLVLIEHLVFKFRVDR